MIKRWLSLANKGNDRIRFLILNQRDGWKKKRSLMELGLMPCILARRQIAHNEQFPGLHQRNQKRIHAAPDI